MSPVFAAGDGKAAAQYARTAVAAVEAKTDDLQEKLADVGTSDTYKAAKEALTALQADSTNIARRHPRRKQILLLLTKSLRFTMLLLPRGNP